MKRTQHTKDRDPGASAGAATPSKHGGKAPLWLNEFSWTVKL